MSEVSASYVAPLQQLLKTMVEYGGTMSHHHGVGRLLAPWMEAHLGKNQMEVLRALKQHFDPHNIMNPGGKLGLDEIPARR